MRHAIQMMAGLALGLGLACMVGAADGSQAGETLWAHAPPSAAEWDELTSRVTELEGSLAALQEDVGRSSSFRIRQPLARRLDDLEAEVGKLERRLDDLERRLRRVETQKP